MLVVYTVEVVYTTLEVLDELVLVTTPLALEVLDATDGLDEDEATDEAADEELGVLLVRVAEAEALEVAETE
jgi:hypothetical protein